MAPGRTRPGRSDVREMYQQGAWALFLLLPRVRPFRLSLARLRPPPPVHRRPGRSLFLFFLHPGPVRGPSFFPVSRCAGPFRRKRLARLNLTWQVPAEWTSGTLRFSVLSLFRLGRSAARLYLSAFSSSSSFPSRGSGGPSRLLYRLCLCPAFPNRWPTLDTLRATIMEILRLSARSVPTSPGAYS